MVAKLGIHRLQKLPYLLSAIRIEAVICNQVFGRLIAHCNTRYGFCKRWIIRHRVLLSEGSDVRIISGDAKEPKTTLLSALFL